MELWIFGLHLKVHRFHRSKPCLELNRNQPRHHFLCKKKVKVKKKKTKFLFSFYSPNLIYNKINNKYFSINSIVKNQPTFSLPITQGKTEEIFRKSK